MSDTTSPIRVALIEDDTRFRRSLELLIDGILRHRGPVVPDPEGMLARLKAGASKEKGLKICVWINPYIAQRSALFDEGMAHGYLLKRPDGSVFQWDRWQSGMGADGALPTFRCRRSVGVDFTNSDACRWYADKLRPIWHVGPRSV